MWNFYARSYDPMAATWLHADPYRGDLSNPQSLGRYGYVGNNPATLTDYLGYAINRLVDGEWGHRNAYRALYKQQQEAKPKPPELPRTNNPFKPLPRTPSDTSNTTARHSVGADLAGVLAIPLALLDWPAIGNALAQWGITAAQASALGGMALLSMLGVLLIALSGDSSTARGDAEARASSDAVASTPASPDPEPDCDPAVVLVCPGDGRSTPNGSGGGSGATVPELEGGSLQTVGKPIWGNGNPSALVGTRTSAELRALASRSDAEKLRDFYQAAVDAGRGGATAPARVRLAQEIIDAWK